MLGAKPQRRVRESADADSGAPLGAMPPTTRRRRGGRAGRRRRRARAVRRRGARVRRPRAAQRPSARRRARPVARGRARRGSRRGVARPPRSRTRRSPPRTSWRTRPSSSRRRLSTTGCGSSSARRATSTGTSKALHPSSGLQDRFATADGGDEAASGGPPRHSRQRYAGAKGGSLSCPGADSVLRPARSTRAARLPPRGPEPLDSMEARGIEPLLQPCKGRVLPLPLRPRRLPKLRGRGRRPGGDGAAAVGEAGSVPGGFDRG